MKTFILLQLFLTISILGICQKDSINDSYLNLALLKVGYHNHHFKCGVFNYYNNCPNCSNDTLPFNAGIVNGKGKDFYKLIFKIQNTNDTIFNALFVWMGSGCIIYPFVNDCYDTTCYSPSPFIPTTNHVPKPSYIDYFNPGGGKVINDTIFKQRADSAWYAIDSLLVTNLFSSYDFKVGIFEYDRSSGGTNGNPDWIVFLYYNDIITKTTENENLVNEFKLYPNPASDKLVLSFPKDLKNNLILIYNMQGQLLLKKEIKDFKNSSDIDLKDLTEGMYILKLQNNKCILTSKFVKE